MAPVEGIMPYQDDEEYEDWHGMAKHFEQQYMVLMDQYNEIARALGFEGQGWWGDVFEPHEEILKEAKFLRQRYVDYVNGKL